MIGSFTPQSTIPITGVNKHYGDHHVLRDINLEIPAGQAIVILGSSGSGKSTLCRTINRLETIDSGGTRTNGKLLPEEGKELTRLCAEVGMVFRQFNLFSHVTIRDSVALASLKVRKLSKAEARECVDKLLARVGTAEQADKYPVQFSGGQQQRVVITHALAVDPKVMLFNEPTSALDPEMINEVLDVMTGLAKDGMTMVCVTHEMNFVRRVAGRILFMADGAIVENTDSETFFTNPQSDRAKDFLAKIVGYQVELVTMKLSLLQGGRGRSCNQGHQGAAGKRVAAVVVAVVMTTSLAACGSDGLQNLLVNIEVGHVMLGTKSDQPDPGECTPDCEFEGVDNDVSRYVIEYIVNKNGWDVPEMEWRETSSAQRETSINNGEANMVVAAYSINAGRPVAVDFAGPYLVMHQVLLVRSSEGIQGLDDVAPGTRLCSVSGSTLAQKVKDALPEVQLQEFGTYAVCVEGVKQGVVDALTTDVTILAGFTQRYKERFGDDFRAVELRNPDGPYWTNEYYGIDLLKGDDASREAINEVLELLYDAGELQKIVKKHLGDKFELGDKPVIGDLSFIEKRQEGVRANNESRTLE